MARAVCSVLVAPLKMNMPFHYFFYGIKVVSDFDLDLPSISQVNKKKTNKKRSTLLKKM